MRIGKYKYLTIESFSFKDIFKPFAIVKTPAYKYISKYIDINIYFLGFHIYYSDTNYNKICHIILRYNNTFKNTDPEGVTNFRKLLNKYINWESKADPPPFSFNYEYVGHENGKDLYNYYITVEKSWLQEHAKFLVPNIVTEIIEIDELKTNEHKFPKYNKFIKKISEV